MHESHFSWTWALIISQDRKIAFDWTARAPSKQVPTGQQVIIERLLCFKPDCATAGWTSLTLGKAFSHVTFCVLVPHFFHASGTLELHLLERLFFKSIKPGNLKGRIPAGGAGVVTLVVVLGTAVAENCLTAAAF